MELKGRNDHSEVPLAVANGTFTSLLLWLIFLSQHALLYVQSLQILLECQMFWGTINSKTEIFAKLVVCLRANSGVKYFTALVMPKVVYCPFSLSPPPDTLYDLLGICEGTGKTAVLLLKA